MFYVIRAADVVLLWYFRVFLVAYLYINMS
jgi:hypothetical protein